MVEEGPGFAILDEFFVDWYKKSGTFVPSHVQQALYELFLNVAIDQPEDLIQYCLDHFTKIKVSKKSVPFIAPDSEMDKDLQVILQQRRHSIYVHTVDPEEDFGHYEDEVHYPKSEQVKVQLALSLRNVFLFRHLDTKDIMEIVKAMFSIEVGPDDLIIKQGDEGDYFYLIERGTFTAFVEVGGVRKNLCTYYGSGSFGELALLYNAPRAASVEANTEGQLWAVERNTFRRIVLKGAFEKRKMYSDILLKVPILSQLQTYDLMNVADAVLETVYTDGKWIFREGDIGDGMYFVVSGTVKIYKREPDRETDIELKQLTSGDYFGELALILLRPRAASARACGTVKLAFLDSVAFARLLPPKVIKRMLTKLEEYQIELKNALGTSQHLL